MNSKIKYTIWLLLSVALLAVGSVGNAGSKTPPTARPSLNIDNMIRDISILKSSSFQDKVPPNEMAGLKRGTAVGFKSRGTWEGIIQLDIAREGEFLKLLWWNKVDDTETRAFIVALDWCERKPPEENAQLWPDSVFDYEGNAKRFAPEERDARLAEARFVRKHRSVLRSKIYEVLKASNLSAAERYKPEPVEDKRK